MKLEYIKKKKFEVARLPMGDEMCFQICPSKGRVLETKASRQVSTESILKEIIEFRAETETLQSLWALPT